MLTEYQFTCNVQLPAGSTVTSYQWSCYNLGSSGTINNQSNSVITVYSSSTSNTATIKWGIEYAPVLETVDCKVTFTNSYGNNDYQICYKNIDIKGIPSSVNLIGPITIQKCCTTAVTYSVSNYGDGNIFNWNIPSGWSVVSGGSSNSTSVTVQPNYTSGGNVTCNVQVSTAPASYSRSASLNISRFEPELAPYSLSKDDPCNGQEIIFTAPMPCGIKEFSWNVPSGWTVVNQTFNSITVLVKESGTMGASAEFWGGCTAVYNQWIYVITTPPTKPKYKPGCPPEDPNGCPIDVYPRFCVMYPWENKLYIEPDEDAESYYIEVSPPWQMSVQGVMFTSYYLDNSLINDVHFHLPNWNSTNQNVQLGYYRVSALNCVGESDMLTIPFKRQLDWWCLCPNYEQCVCPPLYEHPGYPCGGGPHRYEEEITSSLTNESILIYPNPASSLIRIQSNKDILNIQIFDLSGRILINTEPHHSSIDIPLQLPDGLYYIRLIEVSGNVSLHKICITN